MAFVCVVVYQRSKHNSMQDEVSVVGPEVVYGTVTIVVLRCFKVPLTTQFIGHIL